MIALTKIHQADTFPCFMKTIVVDEDAADGPLICWQRCLS